MAACSPRERLARGAGGEGWPGQLCGAVGTSPASSQSGRDAAITPTVQMWMAAGTRVCL